MIERSFSIDVGSLVFLEPVDEEGTEECAFRSSAGIGGADDFSFDFAFDDEVFDHA